MLPDSTALLLCRLLPQSRSGLLSTNSAAAVTSDQAPTSVTNPGEAGGGPYRVLAGAGGSEGGVKMDALKQEAEHLKNDIRVSEGSPEESLHPNPS